MLCVDWIYNEKEKRRTFDTDHIVIGRQREGISVDLDLSPDLLVSRRHARAWIENGQLWVEDLNSGGGTKVNDRPIESRAKQALADGDKVTIGETVLRLIMSAEEIGHQTVASTKDVMPSRDNDGASLDASQPVFSTDGNPGLDLATRLSLFY